MQTTTQTTETLTYSETELAELREAARQARYDYVGWTDAQRRDAAAPWAQVSAELLAAGHVGASATCKATAVIVDSWTMDDVVRREG